MRIGSFHQEERSMREKVLEEKRTETTDTIPDEDIFAASDTLGASTRRALVEAQAWFESQDAAASDGGATS
jgi:hypothetical protein